MSKMIRKQVYIRPAHEQLLRQRARALGLTQAALIREGIDQLAHTAAVAPDAAAWATERRYIARHRRLKVAQTGRRWTRDQLYAERVARPR